MEVNFALVFSRYFVLFEHGGVYADLDSECLKPLHPIVEEYSCILSQEPLEHAHFLGPLGMIIRPFLWTLYLLVRLKIIFGRKFQIKIDWKHIIFFQS